MGSSQERHYRVLPVPRGELKSTEQNRLVGDTVKDKEGKNIGTLENLIIDSGTGKIEAAVIGYRTANGRLALRSLPYARLGAACGEAPIESVSYRTVSVQARTLPTNVQRLSWRLRESSPRYGNERHRRRYSCTAVTNVAWLHVSGETDSGAWV
jgi:sporulation protein YlmC with PRC-barrel domain